MGLSAFAVSSAATIALAAPTRPGDCDLNWSIDRADVALLAGCLSGPEAAFFAGCDCHDMDADGDVDLGDFAALQTEFYGTEFLRYGIAADVDDGTEVNGSVWHTSGYAGSGSDRMGVFDAEWHDTGLRFHVPDIQPGETFVHARLVIPAVGEGQVISGVALRIVGVDQDSPSDFTVAPPSALPKTAASVPWALGANWPSGAGADECQPLYRNSPDIASIINEVVSRPGWGSGPEGRTLALIIEDAGSQDSNCVALQDYAASVGECTRPVCAVLELCRTVGSTLVARELLGRPTDHSVTVNAYALVTLEAYVEYGVASGVYVQQTPVVTYPDGQPLEIMLDGLSADTQHFYRLRYRLPGQPDFAAGTERTFYTQRPPGTEFTFTVQSDGHVERRILQFEASQQEMYHLVLQNALAESPDFHIDLGDTFLCESYGGRDVLDFEEAVTRHLDQRHFFDLLCHSAPLFVALGNHEGEQGWRLDGTADNVAVWATNARKLTYPLPAPDTFYAGNTEDVAFVGLREDYYAWEWGDALFVVLDPYWYTTVKPHGAGGTWGSGDNWDWTLGRDQYDWLVQTLEQSPATFKFVFSHQVTGGVMTYGRGGVEAASHALGARGSFEWGGEDLDGTDAFDLKRPGWGRTIHELMVDTGVTIFFHGHDHVFVKQELDGVIYQLCPMLSTAFYGQGFYDEGRYFSGDKVNNSGHLRVTVSPAQVVVDYVRAYLPGDGPNGEIAYSYVVPAAARD